MGRLTARWLAHDEMAAFLQDGAVLTRLVHHQHRYLDQLFGGALDAAHVESMLQMGATHHRIRLPPQWYLASVANVVGDHLDLAWEASTSDADAVEGIIALVGSVLFDASLVLDAYEMCAEHEILRAVVADPTSEPPGAGGSEDGSAKAVPPSRPPRRPLAKLAGAVDEAASRRRFVGLEDRHLAALGAIAPVIEVSMPSILADFYELVGAAPSLTDLAPPAVVPHLMDAVGEYWIELATGAFDDAYASSRKRIGLLHERVGLAPQYHLAGLSRQIAGLLRSLVRPGADLRLECEAVLRAAVFDLTFVIDAYMEARADALLQIGRYAAPVVAGLASGIAIVDARDRVTYANEQLLGIVGIAAGVLHRLPVGDALPLAGIEELIVRARTAPDSRVTAVHEAWGRRFRVTGLALQHAVTGREGLVAVVLDDITDLVAAGASHDHEERRLDFVIDAVDAMVWELDRADLVVLAASRAAQVLLGVRDVDLLGRRVLIDYVHPSDAPAFVDACRSISDGERREFVHRVCAADGKQSTVRTSLVGTRWGGAATVCGVTVDIGGVIGTTAGQADETRGAPHPSG